MDTVYNPSSWGILGGNFRYTDIQASIGRNQLKSLQHKISHCQLIYNSYKRGLSSLSDKFSLIEVSIQSGELPIYNEFQCSHRQELLDFLAHHGVNSRPFYPSISQASYLPSESTGNRTFLNSINLSRKGIYLPSGTNLPIESVDKVISLIHRFFSELPS